MVIRMKFTIQMFWESPANGLEPFLLPLSLDFSSVEEARSAFDKVACHPNVPVHSLTLKSENGSISERWFQIDGQWRRKEV
jgi:hypothetical protein